MLANLDVLIGTIVILLGVSLIVTIVNQTLSTALALRGRNLRWGLAMLIQELHAQQFARPRTAFPLFGRDLNLEVSDAVDHVLSHPLVSDSKAPVLWWRLASTIRFDEFIKTILLSGDQAPPAASQPPTPGHQRAHKAQEVLSWLRENHRITEPWFNSVMDRVSQRFVMHTRIYSVVVSLVIVAVIGMDTVFIVNTLRSDAALRGGLLTVAGSLSQADNLSPEERQRLSAFAKNVSDNLPQNQSLSALLFRPFSPESIPGMLLSVVLLSLGAPFWFSILKNLVSLRSVVAKKDDQERASPVPDVGDRIRVRSF